MKRTKNDQFIRTSVFYRPQRSWGKVIFSEACGMHGRGRAWRGGHAWQGVCAWQEGHAWQGGMHGRGACMAWGACMAGGACMGGMRGRRAMPLPLSPARYYEIRSMSGRYASYWNAFFFNFRCATPECWITGESS